MSHPTGNANVKFALDGLHRAGLLTAFHTSIASFPDNFWGKLSNINGFSEFNRRAFNSYLEGFTTTHPIKEMGRILSTKLRLNSLIAHEKGIFCIDNVYDSIDRAVANSLLKNKFDALYAYEDGALESFRAAKSRGINCLYDLPIGYWRAGRTLLEEERINRPEWATTLGGFKDSEKKLLKKDVELSLSDHIFVASSFTKKTLELYPNKLAEISVIPYGFPEVCKYREYSSSINNRKLKLLFVGGLSQRKGIANVFEAVSNLRNHVELTIIGNKTAEDCRPLNVELLRHRWIPSLPHSEILKEMRAHDILLFPSLFEGFGLVITEAMSQGTPVITTDRTIGGDIIKHGENGWLVKPGDTKNLQEMIEIILQSTDELEDISQNAIATASHRPWYKYGDELALAITNLNVKRQ